jgi:hypothetical protein
MQKVIFQFLKKLPLDPLPSKKKRRFSIQMVFFVLLFAGISQTATSWSSSVLQDLGSTIPSADSVLDVVESISEEKMIHYINTQLQKLPRRLSRINHKHAPKHRYLIIDFHRDPSYSKKYPKGVTKGQPKASTQYAWSFLTAELLIGERRETIAIVPRHQNEPIIKHVSCLFAEIPDPYKFHAVLFDGEFATTDVIRFFSQKGLHFLGRFPARGDFKQIMKNAAPTPEAKSQRFWIQTSMTNRNGQDAHFQLTWEWTPGGPKLLVKDIDWDLTIASAEDLYFRRFHIETGFRDTHLFQPRTNTSNISVRLMLIFIARVWENMMEYCSESEGKGTVRKKQMKKQIRSFKYCAMLEMIAMAPMIT